MVKCTVQCLDSLDFLFIKMSGLFFLNLALLLVVCWYMELLINVC